MRPKGSRNTLVKIDYDSIGALVGIRGNTARRYAQRGLFDPRDGGEAAVLRSAPEEGVAPGIADTGRTQRHANAWIGIAK